jgi:hypothetical protein
MKTVFSFSKGGVLALKDFPLLELLHATEIRGV